MKKSEFKSYDDLPLFLNAELVAQVLGISPASSYGLMRVVANSVSLASPQAARLTHYVAPPFPTQALCACAGAPFEFPTLRIGSRMVVPKEKFISWVETYTKGDCT